MVDGLAVQRSDRIAVRSASRSADHRRPKQALIPLASVLALALAGCTSGGASGSRPAASSSPSVVRSEAAGLPVTHEGETRKIDPGTYITTKPDGFFPGLTLTIPAGWSVTEADSGEIALHPSDRPDDAMRLWKDMVAVVTHNRGGKVGQPDETVPSTAAGLVAWLTSTPEFDIVSPPKTVVIGQGITGKQLTLTTSSRANFGWNDCPDNPRCAAILTDPKHWGSNFYAIGGAETSRIFVTTRHYPSGDHTFFVALDALNAGELTSLAERAEPIIDSLRLPATYVPN